MNKIILSVENTCDIPLSKLDELGVKHISLNYRNETTGEENPNLSIVEFYNQLRQGMTFKTSLINQYEFEEYFSKLADDADVIHLSFSSGLSGTCECAKKASEVVNMQGKGRVCVVDTLTGSGAQAILLLEALKKVKEGKTLDEIVTFVEDLKGRLSLYFSPEDLKTLAKSGRCSIITAFIGSILNIKPIIVCNKEGKFSVKHKVISRKKALLKMIEQFKETYNLESEYVYILHGDKIADAEFVRDEILKEEKFKNVNIIIEYLGTIVGAHGGVGNICLCYTSDS